MSGNQHDTVEAEAPGKTPRVEYSMSNGFVQRLRTLDVSVAFTSYQSGLLYLVGASPRGGAHVHQSVMPKPMGLHYSAEEGLVLASGPQIVRYRNVVRPGEYANEIFDACFIPRTLHITGTLDAHDVGVNANGDLIFVNTRFNCLARPHATLSFEPVWHPPFITEVVDEDRCHLNGLAFGPDREPAYVTAVSRSNTIDGWRDRRADGGVIVDVSSSEVIVDGLSMPHSPRVSDGQLWVLNSGTGEIGRVLSDASGKTSHRFSPVAFCPGFVRGLDFAGKHAFVGLSRPRYKRFEGLELDKRLQDADSEPWCGIQIIDTENGQCVDWFRIDGDIAELYDVAVLPGIACPMAASPGTSEVATFVNFTLPTI